MRKSIDAILTQECGPFYQMKSSEYKFSIGTIQWCK